MKIFQKGKEGLVELKGFKNLNEHITRIIVGTLLFLIVSFFIYKGSLFLMLFLTFISFLGSLEFSKVIKNKIGNENFLPFIIIISLYLPFYYFLPFTSYETILIFLLLILFFSLTFFKIGNGIYWTFLFSFLLLYLPFLLSFAIEIREIGKKPLFYFLFTVLIYDTFAFYIGKFFGKTKLLERISPNKTLEGFIGGLIAVILFNLFSFKFWELPIPSMPFLSIILPISAQIGDFFESYLKRCLEIKDFSNILLSHGGILDRIDSYLFALPIFYLILRITL